MVRLSLAVSDPKLARHVLASINRLDKPMATEMVRDLRGGGSRWPVGATGASKRGWGVMVIRGNHVRLTNSQAYAPFVEARGITRKRKARGGTKPRKRPGPARTTLRKGLKPLVATLEKVVGDRLRRGRFGGR